MTRDGGPRTGAGHRRIDAGRTRSALFEGIVAFTVIPSGAEGSRRTWPRDEIPRLRSG
ncbi:MAG: hypothetical protein AVDCRST_MAG59-1240 [uncultured Thermomicrobiales bacterium]|uniref:Uncharacterized protein n=1 Tax=uncultured Thermomicrobiales bacterium TaxID=1645740 RepID=A0A6J4UDI9_9BACT|nr:MAG: hypothetical protein AVDCRST_MAG59-1240 [uncultured Thermomicrobiales bacterium]